MAKTERERDRGNFVSEWFGHRVYPKVMRAQTALADQRHSTCPFLTGALGTPTKCVKAPTSSGICTVSSASNGPRQDWLVCPLRGLDVEIISDITHRLFDLESQQPIWIVPAPKLALESFRLEFEARVLTGEPAFVYLQSKLGGEISIPQTEASPELSFDTTLVQVVGGSGGFRLSRYGIFEMQTMDYHGSYSTVVENLEQALRLHKDRFHETLDGNRDWLGENMEGPNKANVFKRTFYQMMLKFQVGADESCAGCVLAVPDVSVG